MSVSTPWMRKAQKNCHSVPSPFFIPTYVYTRMLIHTHTHTHTHTQSCPHLDCSPPCPALPWGSGSSNSGILLHQPNEKEITSAKANVNPGPGAQTHLCLNFSLSTPWALPASSMVCWECPQEQLGSSFLPSLPYSPASPAPRTGPSLHPPPQLFSSYDSQVKFWLSTTWPHKKSGFPGLMAILCLFLVFTLVTFVTFLPHVLPSGCLVRLFPQERARPLAGKERKRDEISCRRFFKNAH